MKLIARSIVPLQAGYTHLGYVSAVNVIQSHAAILGKQLMVFGAGLAVAWTLLRLYDQLRVKAAAKRGATDHGNPASQAGGVQVVPRLISRKTFLLGLIVPALVFSAGLVMFKLAPPTREVYSGRWMMGRAGAAYIGHHLEQYARAHDGKYPTFVNAHLRELKDAGIDNPLEHELLPFDLNVNSTETGYTISLKASFDGGTYTLDNKGHEGGTRVDGWEDKLFSTDRSPDVNTIQGIP